MPIAFTPGEPSGIGPDIAIIYAQKEIKENLKDDNTFVIKANPLCEI